jgi:lysophospholipase L1-like esterase
MSPGLLARCLAVALLMGVATAPASGQQFGTDRRLFVLGDSVMVGAQGAVVAGLPDWQVTVQADVGLSLLGAASIVRERREEIGEVAVIALGANDGTDPAAFAQRIDGMMDALAGVPRVLWIDQATFETGRSALNDVLVAAAVRHPSIEVVDWASEVAAHPEYVAPDGLHLSASGQQAMTQTIAGRLSAWVAANAAPPPSLFGEVGALIARAIAAPPGLVGASR